MASFSVSQSSTCGSSNIPELAGTLQTGDLVNTPQNTNTTPLAASNLCTLTNASADDMSTPATSVRSDAYKADRILSPVWIINDAAQLIFYMRDCAKK